MTTAPEPPLRRDAERNRLRILDAARALFAESGLAVTLDEVARQAGVGVGTVYRRFAGKERLIEALFEERLDRVGAIAREAHAHADPWAGIVFFLEGLLGLMAEDRGLKELLLGTEHGRARVNCTRSEIMPLIADLLARAKAAGQVRPDVEIADLMLVQHAVGEVETWLHGVDPQAWRRLLAIALDGLRPRAAGDSTPMPGAPLDDAGLTCALAAYRPRAR